MNQGGRTRGTFSLALTSLRIMSSRVTQVVAYYRVSFFFRGWVIRHCGLPWRLSRKESACQCRRCGFDPWVRKIPWRTKWQPIPVFLPEKSHGQRSLVGYSPWGCKESDITEPLNNNRNSSLIMRDSSSQSTCSKSRGNCRKSEGMIELRKKKPIILQLLLKVDLSKDHQCMKPLNERLMGEF